ncbi:hypothetical protein TUM4637_33160 [Shewanella hafniensis]|nr:hypothetical protein TUM4637_33160 [Shewanella hafniensis]
MGFFVSKAHPFSPSKYLNLGTIAPISHKLHATPCKRVQNISLTKLQGNSSYKFILPKMEHALGRVSILE